MIIIISNNDKKKRSIDHTLSIYRLINNSCGMLGEEEKFVNHELRVTDAINDWFFDQSGRSWYSRTCIKPTGNYGVTAWYRFHRLGILYKTVNTPRNWLLSVQNLARKYHFLTSFGRETWIKNYLKNHS